jgi:hypothetical protein
MFNRKFLASVILAGAALVPSASFAAAQAERPPCILRSHHITSVAPYSVVQHRGRSTTKRLAGARVYVQAEPGLTAEWLELTLSRHIAEMHGPTDMKGCAFDMKDVGVKVESARAGFAVNVIARNPSQAGEVLRRARLLIQ